MHWPPEIHSISGPVGLITVAVLFVCLGIGLERLVFWTRLWGVRRLVGLRRCRASEAALTNVARLAREGRLAAASREAKRS